MNIYIIKMPHCTNFLVFDKHLRSDFSILPDAFQVYNHFSGVLGRRCILNIQQYCINKKNDIVMEIGTDHIIGSAHNFTWYLPP